MERKQFIAPSRVAMKLIMLQLILLIAFTGVTFGKSEAGAPATSDLLKVVVRGKVSDSKGVVMPGVGVTLKGGNTRVITDANGMYSIDVPATATLVFTFVGFTTKEVAVNNNTSLDVVLSADNTTLEEVVITGYGAATKLTSTGSVANVKTEELVKTNASTASDALVGRVAGLTSRNGGGVAEDARPGNGIGIQIRNLGTPMYVIDNIPSDAAAFNQLGVNDIENIAIMKDGAAAIYGLRASNGVVLVTTKKGKAGEKATIAATGYYGVSNFTNYFTPADAVTFLTARNQAAQNIAEANNTEPKYDANASAAEIEKWRAGGFIKGNQLLANQQAAAYKSSNYADYIFQSNVPKYEMNVSARGGSEQSAYFFSLSFLNQDDIIKDYRFNRYNFTTNLESSLAKGLKVSALINGRLEARGYVGVPGIDEYLSIFRATLYMWPIERPYANENPNYLQNVHDINRNPGTFTKQITGWNEEKNRNFTGTFMAEYQFPFGLKVLGTMQYRLGVRRFENQEFVYNSFNYSPATDQYVLATGGGNQNPFRRKTRELPLRRYKQMKFSYDKKFGQHSLNTIAAVEQEMQFDDFMQYNTLPANNFVYVTRVAQISGLEDRESHLARESYVANVVYNYKQKYNIEAGGRYEGISRYAPSSRYGFFPTIGASWNASEEPFFKNAFGDVVNLLKVRFRYGQTGDDNNQNPNDVLNEGGQPVYDYGGAGAVLNNVPVIGLAPRSSLPPLNLTWTKVTSYNFGIDVNVFNKLRAELDVFRSDDTGLPAARYDVLLPGEVGYSLPNENLESRRTYGFDGLIGYDTKIGAVNFSSDLVATFARTKTLSRYKLRPGNSYEVYEDVNYNGRVRDINFNYEIDGQFQSQEQIDNHPVNVDGQGNRTLLPGDIIYRDNNGDGIINGLDRRAIGYGTGQPMLSFGLNNTFSYKNWSLDLAFAGASLYSFVRTAEARVPFSNTANGSSPDWMFQDVWRHENAFDVTSPWIPGANPPIRKDLTSHSSYSRNSSFYNMDIFYIRLRNVQLGYTFPQSLVRKIGAQSLRMTFSMVNAFTIDNGSHKFNLDPEVQLSSGLVSPQTRFASLGFNLTL